MSCFFREWGRVRMTQVTRTTDNFHWYNLRRRVVDDGPWFLRHIVWSAGTPATSLCSGTFLLESCDFELFYFANDTQENTNSLFLNINDCIIISNTFWSMSTKAHLPMLHIEHDVIMAIMYRVRYTSRYYVYIIVYTIQETACIILEYCQ